MAAPPETSRETVDAHVRARGVNDVMRRLSVGLVDVDEPIAWLCECARPGCAAAVRLPPSAFEALRAEPGHFAVAAGHEVDDDVVVRRDGDVVVVRV